MDFLFYENYLNFNNSIWMSFIFVCFHFSFINFFLFLKRKKSRKILSAMTLQRLFYLFVTVKIESEHRKMAQKNFISHWLFLILFVVVLLLFFSFTCSLALEFYIHILLPLFTIHFTVVFGSFVYIIHSA